MTPDRVHCVLCVLHDFLELLLVTGCLSIFLFALWTIS
jgi:hypothetical protein